MLIKLYTLNKLIEKKQEVNIYLEVKNRRDEIVILDGNKKIFENSRQYQDPLNKEYEKSGNRINGIESYTVFENVDTSKIMYPFQSGGWGDRCIMKQVFGDMDLFHTSNNSYRFFEENEMHYTVSQTDYLKNICSKRGLCSKLLEKFRTGSYIVPKEDKWNDDICLEEKNGVYKIYNGNHRVCCSRMFEIPFIKAKVYREPNREIENEFNEDITKSYYLPLNRVSTKDLTRDYYSILYRLGLNKRQTYEILEKGLRGKSFLDYIEKSIGKNILELYNISNM